MTDASRTWWSLRFFASACLGLILALSACGGGGNPSRTHNASTTTTNNPQTRTAAEFRQEANAICFRLYETKVPKGTTSGLAALSPALRAANSSLDALKPPPALVKVDHALLTDEKQEETLLPKFAKEAKAAKPPHYAALRRFLSTSREILRLTSRDARLWTALGSEACVNGPLAKYTG
jgi:hypothetical protein